METSQLQNLMQYTIFHIGVYITLLGAIIGFQGNLTFICHINIPFILFLIAGGCGGAIASNIPDFESFSAFKNARLKVLGISLFNYSVFATIEHASFWLGTVWIAISFLFK